MLITFTDTAVRELEPKLRTKPAALRLVFDSEGYGCSVKGRDWSAKHVLNF